VEVHYGIIAAGEKVIMNQTFIEKLVASQGKIIAIAMEGVGVARAALNQVNPVPFIEIRGISDFADSTKKDDWQPYAAETAAAFTMGWLKNHPLPSKS
jgi:nucleoside phosphorylase